MVSRSGNASRFNESNGPLRWAADTGGVRGMNVAGKVDGIQNRVLAMDIAKDDSELFVVTENGYGKRTPVPEYPVKGRGTKGVLTIKMTEKKGGLAGALIVREHQDLLFISQNGMVQRTNAGGISQMGRATQGVKVMNIKDDDRVSAVALVVESGGGRGCRRRHGAEMRSGRAAADEGSRRARLERRIDDAVDEPVAEAVRAGRRRLSERCRSPTAAFA